MSPSITNFEFSYQPSGYVDITLSITGTSNTYTDIKVFMPTDEESKKEAPATKTVNVVRNPTYDPVITTPPADKNNPQSVTGVSSFYQKLYKKNLQLCNSYIKFAFVKANV